MIVRGAFLVAGEARGTALVLAEPLSFWGGVDAPTGDIVDRSHPDCGANLAGRVLVMPSGRGSSSSSSVLAEALRRGRGPIGIVMARPDPILTVGAIVATRLYGVICPIVVCALDDIRNGDVVSMTRGPNGAMVTIDTTRP